ncbi:ABC transporter ATP-binding protein [Paucibacter sp. R3-3]|uniref:ABC transporter ATP-binding protein n=1 Tax=Roseateles agri TaxID=3098619 RepID=A0ABU5DMZ8_9BURK|nr:ABC transporter ATP-binding protein [Paucibacter sp. R3-3]MDY0747680.1 ABC transporter ATP-binding protein [Paucibacter sp. R3-3]
MSAGTVSMTERDHVFASFDGNTASRLLGLLARHRSAAWWALLCIGLYTAAQVAIPAAVRAAVDSALGAPARLPVVMAVFLLLLGANAVFGFLQEWTAARLAQRVIFELRRAMYAHLQDVPLARLEDSQVGKLMARLQGDVGALQDFLENSVSAIGDLFLLLGIVIVLLCMDWQLGLMTLAVLPALVLIRARWMPWARRVFARAREASSTVNAALAENINGIRTVQETRRESVNLARYGGLAEEHLQAQLASSRASQLMVPAVDVLTGLALALVVVLGGAHVLQGSLGVGVMVAFIFYVQRFFEPIRTLSMQYTVMQRAMAAGQRIFEVLDMPGGLAHGSGTLDPQALEPSIELRGVRFGYREGHDVLRDLDLRIEAGQTIALVGPTGSGKTSITSLIRRFHDVQVGQVLLGGCDVRELSSATLGRAIGMVQQEPFLFSGSVADNIGYGLPGATREQIEQVARQVRAHDFISRLPQGYDTQLGQRGRNLSIGQRQLLSFARTLLADPAVLILDEATANIDSFTEQDIQHALRVLSAGRTTIIVAHRLSTVREADRIFVLGQGRVLESGSHAELMTRGGRYARMVAGH